MAILVASTVIFATSEALAEAQWRHVGTLGQRHLVLMDVAVQDNVEQLNQAARAVCEPSSPCLVAFWSDVAAVPIAMPMSAAQQQAMVAQYVRNPASGKEELLLKCPPYSAASAKCLR
ncbi:MAG TPA: hypothetical protein PLB25_01305 [Rhodoferax sp.]|nr:hypothetical protein [Rhodoferax sp.]